VLDRANQKRRQNNVMTVLNTHNAPIFSRTRPSVAHVGSWRLISKRYQATAFAPSTVILTVFWASIVHLTLRISLLISLSLLLTACGQQGPLVPADAFTAAADSAMNDKPTNSRHLDSHANSGAP